MVGLRLSSYQEPSSGSRLRSPSDGLSIRRPRRLVCRLHQPVGVILDRLVAERPQRPTHAGSRCGWGQLSRELAGRGAAVTAVDLSGKLLERARDIERRHPVGIRYVHGDATCMDWWDGTAYDGVVCNMALMDIDDLEAALRTVASVWRPSGWFNLSLLHPCFPGDASVDALPSWPPDRGYAAEGWWTHRVGRRARSCRCSPPDAVDLPERRAARRTRVRVVHRAGRRPSPRGHHSGAAASPM